MTVRTSLAAWLAVALLPAAAQATVPAQTQAAPERPVGIVSQSLSRGEETGRVILAGDSAQAPVYVRSVQPDSVQPSAYRIAFASLDANGDGYIDRNEAAAHPLLADEFKALDTKHRGRLERSDLAGWLTD